MAALLTTTVLEGDGSGSPCTGYTGLATRRELAASPRENTDAELLALEGSGALVAPTAVYERVVRDLATIRRVWPEVSDIRVAPLAAPGSLLLAFDDVGFAMVTAGTYHGWDCANAYYDVSPDWFRSEVQKLAGVETPHRLAPKQLAAVYSSLPHITGVHLNARMGGSSTIQLVIDGDFYRYTFDRGSGDCPAGCIDHEYTRFVSDGEGDVRVVEGERT